MTLQDVQLPAVFRAKSAGRIIEARTLDELASALSPVDLARSEDVEIFDSAGRCFVAERGFAVRATGVEAVLTEQSELNLDALRTQFACLAASHGWFDRRIRIYESRDLGGMIRALFDQEGQPSAGGNAAPPRASA